MKTAGALTLVGAFILGLVFALLPTQVSLLGAEGSCGAPIFTAFNDVTAGDEFGIGQSINEQCRSQSAWRLFLAGVVAVIGGIGGLLMLLLSPSRAERERRQFEQWQQWQWEKDQHAQRQWEQEQNAQHEWEQQYAEWQQQHARWQKQQGRRDPQRPMDG